MNNQLSILKDFEWQSFTRKFEVSDHARYFLTLCIIRAAMELAYITCLSPVYGYAGFNIDISVVNLLFGIISLVVLASISPIDENRPSTYLYFMLLTMIYLPVSSYAWLNGQKLGYLAIVTCAFIIISGVVRLRPFQNLRAPSFSVPRCFFDILFGILVLLTTYLVIKYGGPNFKAFDLFIVHEIREGIHVGTLDGYILNWNVKALIPFFIAFSLYKKRYSMLFITILLQAAYYLTFAAKAYLLSIVLMVVVYCLMRNKGFVKRFALFLASGHLFAIFSTVVLNSYNALYLWTLRMVYEPAKVAYWFYDFFNDREKHGYSEGLLGKVLGTESAYELPINYVVSGLHGEAYNSNTGAFSDAFANGGILAVVLVTILLGLVLVLIDNFSRQIPNRITVTGFAFTMSILMDGALQTALFSGGLALLLILFMLFSMDERSRISTAEGYDEEGLRT